MLFFFSIKSYDLKFRCYLYYLYWIFVPECRCQWQPMKTIPDCSKCSQWLLLYIGKKGMELVFILFEASVNWGKNWCGYEMLFPWSVYPVGPRSDVNFLVGWITTVIYNTRLTILTYYVVFKTTGRASVIILCTNSIKLIYLLKTV